MSKSISLVTRHLSLVTALLNSSSLRRTAAVVRNRRRVTNRRHTDARVVDGADCGLASAARPFNAHFALLHPGLLRFLRGLPRRLLRGERSAFTRAAKTPRA